MNWELPWYVFGDLVTMIQATDNYRLYLVQRLEALAKDDPVEFRSVLQGNKTTGGEPKLFALIREIPEIKLRKKLKWKPWESNSWPQITPELDLETCKLPSGFPELKGQIIITPKKIYLPWPFSIQGGAELEKKFDAREMKPSEYDPNRHLLADPGLCPPDEIIKDVSNAKYVGQFRTATTSKAVRKVILDYCIFKGNPITLPGNCEFRVDNTLPTDQARIKSDGDTLYFHIGLYTGGASQPLYDSWPDGAFVRNNT